MPLRSLAPCALPYGALICLFVALHAPAASAQCIPPPGQQQTQPCSDDAPPEVQLSPGTDAFLHTEVPVTITWWDRSPNSYVQGVTWNGTAVTGAFNASTRHETMLIPDELEPVWVERGTATGSVVMLPGQANQLQVSVCDRDLRCSTRGAQYTLAPQPGVEVTPRTFDFRGPAAGNQTYAFTLWNRGGQTATFALAAQCREARTGLALAVCSPSPGSVTVAPGASQQVTLSYSVPAPGRALALRLRASQTGVAGVHDVGWVDVTHSATPTSPVAGVPTAAVVDLNSTAEVDRAQCVTIAAGPGAAYECGDLRLVYGLPVHRTRGRGWAPALLYNSQHAAPRPTVHVDVTLPAGVTPPGQVEVAVTVNGGTHRRYFRGSDWAPGTTRRVAVQWDAPGWTTGVYPYQLQVINHYGGGASFSTAAQSGTLAVVNRAWSPWGAGWWWSGLEALHCTDCGSGGSRMLWVGGDGSTRIFIPQTPGQWSEGAVWTAARLDGPPDTLRLNYPGGIPRYTRVLRGGGQVHFDTDGRHVATVNRLEQKTVFSYAGARLASVAVPGEAGGPAWSFAYTPSGEVDSIRATVPGQAARTVVLARAGGNRLSSITGPDQKQVRFAYDAAQAGWVSDRYAQDSARVQFAYDAAGKLASWRTFPQGAPAAGDPVTTVASAEGVGAALRGDTTYVSAPVSMVYTRIDGPRTDVVDHTWVWAGVRGAPVRVMDAMGGETLVVRDLSYPLLVREVIAPNGLRRRARYDSRGRLAADTLFDPLGDGRHAVTLYTWDDRWHKPTRIASYQLANGTLTPLADAVQAEYDPVTGNTLWQQQGGIGRRTLFGYYTSGPAAGQLASVRQPADASGLEAIDSLFYDARGNLRMTRSPTGILALVYRDAWGRDTLAVTPVDSATATDSAGLRNGGVRVRTQYDAMDRPRVTETIAPPVQQRESTDQRWPFTPPATPEERLRVETSYDDTGRATDVTRRVWPDTAHIGTLTTHYDYDRAGRMWQQTGSQGATRASVFDAAGNTIEAHVGSHPIVTMQYDALGRLVRRTVPEVTHLPEYSQIGLLQHEPVRFPRFPNAAAGRYRISAEETWYRYDAAGNQVYAQNGDALVRRSYYPNGALRGDTLQPRDYQSPYYSQGYGLEYAYDMAGRVTSMKHPQNLAAAQNLDQYAYHLTTGGLRRVTSRMGDSVRWEHDNLDRPTVTHLPGGVQDSVRYDLEGRLVWHRVGGPSTGGDLLNETMQYDVRGKLVRASNFQSIFQQWYSGIGNLVATDWQAIGELNRYVEQYAIDPLGNVVLTETGDGLRLIGAPGNNPRIKRYEPGQARVIAMSYVVPADSGSSFLQDSTAQWYDDAGNLLGSYSYSESAHSESQSKHFYGADNRLRVVQRVAVRNESESYDPELSGVWEEYRYDPLGRRILVRTRTDGGLCDVDPWTCTGSITRFVWAGDQILWELKAPGNDGADLENTTGLGASYGRVSYTHAGGVDRPLVITKNGVSVVPHQNWRGMFALGTNPAGGRDVPDIDWPGFHTTPWHGPTRVVENWYGGLSTEMRDATGQLYKRNRYYDPASGQFTQPDPMGLAGGLNSYGFAAGDPVSYSDPYGLRVEFANEASRRLWNDLAGAALRAMNSEDADVRQSARHLNQMLREVWDAEETVSIDVGRRWGIANRYWGGASTHPSNRVAGVNSEGRVIMAPTEIRMDPTYTARRFGLPNPVTLAHELGHAWANLTGRRSNDATAIWAENMARAVFGCNVWRADHGSFPPCRGN